MGTIFYIWIGFSTKNVLFVGFVFPSTSLLMSLDRKVGFGLGLGSKKLVFWVFGYLNPSLKVNRTDFGLSDHCVLKSKYVPLVYFECLLGTYG